MHVILTRVIYLKIIKEASAQYFCIGWQTSYNQFIKTEKFLAHAACVRHVCLRAPCVAWPLLLPSFSLLSNPSRSRRQNLGLTLFSFVTTTTRMTMRTLTKNLSNPSRSRRQNLLRRLIFSIQSYCMRRKNLQENLQNKSSGKFFRTKLH